MPDRMSRDELLARMQAGYERFKTLLTQCSAQQMIQTGTVETWSVKDTLAHIVVHQQRMNDWLEQRLRGIVPATAQPYDMAEDDLAVLNEHIFQQNRNRSLSDLCLDLDAAHARSLAIVESAQETDLFDADHFSLSGGEPLRNAVAANTFEHYQEHGQAISRWLEKENP